MNDNARPKILLVDDDRHLLVTLADYLTFEGFEVNQADSGEAALRLIASHPPDLVVLDIGMPGMGGLGFLRQIADELGAPRYPVIVLTARGSMEGFFDTSQVDAFLPKPCAGVDLVREIRATLTRRALGAREAARQRGRILLVENHEPTATRLTAAFSGAGFAVEVIHRGLDIFRAVAGERPDVIVAKEMLPAMKGSAVALMVKGHQSTAGIPFVLYDGSNLMQTHVQQGTPPPRSVSVLVLTDDAETVLEAVEGALVRPAGD